MILRKFVLIILSLLTALSMCSCSDSENYYLELEIRCADGSSIRIKQSEKLEKPIFWAQIPI